MHSAATAKKRLMPMKSSANGHNLQVLFLLCLLFKFDSASAEEALNGRLYKGQLGQHSITACITEDSGEYYLTPYTEVASAADARAEPAPLGTWLLARQPPPRNPSAQAAAQNPSTGGLTNIWNTAAKGSCCLSSLDEPADGEPVFDQLELRRNGLDGWTGTYKDHSSKDERERTDKGLDQAQIQMRLTASNCNDFERQRLALPWQAIPDSDAIAGQPQSSALIKAQYLKHPVTGVTSVYLRPGRFLKAPEAISINAAIMKIASDMNEAWASCEAFDGGITVQHVSRQMVVLDATFDSYCGGAHPYEHAQIHSFDTQTGQPILFGSWLLKPAGSKTKIPDRLLKKVFGTIDDDSACLERMVQMKSFSLWMAPSGMQFRFDENGRPFIHCRGDYELPFDAVKPFIKKSRRAEFGKLVKSFR